VHDAALSPHLIHYLLAKIYPVKHAVASLEEVQADAPPGQTILHYPLFNA
jgi:hypothetical protein